MWNGFLDAIEKIFKEKGGNVCQDFLPKVKCPTLIIHGQKDLMVTQFLAEYIHEHIAGSVLHLMPEGRHNLHLRYADEFNEMVTEFLKSREEEEVKFPSSPRF